MIQNNQESDLHQNFEQETELSSKQGMILARSTPRRQWLLCLVMTLSLLAVIAMLVVVNTLKEERDEYQMAISQLSTRLVRQANENAALVEERDRQVRNLTFTLKSLIRDSNELSANFQLIQQTNNKVGKKVDAIKLSNNKLQQAYQAEISKLKEVIAEISKKIDKQKANDQKVNSKKQKIFEEDIIKMREEIREEIKEQMMKQMKKISKQSELKTTADLEKLKQVITVIQQQQQSMSQQILKIKEQKKLPTSPSPTPKKEDMQNEKIDSKLYNENALIQKKQHQNTKIAFVEAKKAAYPGSEFIIQNLNLKKTNSDENLLYYSDLIPNLQSDVGKTPFCVIVPNYLSHPLHYVEYTLNSIFRQQYQLLQAIIFSSPNEEINQFILKYLELNSIPAQRYKFIRTTGKPSILENIATAVEKHCQAGSMAMVIEGGNEILGKYVLQIYNEFIQLKGLALIYSNYYQFKVGERLDYGATIAINKNQIDNNKYRSTKRNQFQLLAFSTDLFKQIKAEDLKDKNGKYFQGFFAAITLPLLELSCGRALKIGGVVYLENINDQFRTKLDAEGKTFDELAPRPAYKCNEAFKKSAEESKRKRNYPPELEEIATAKHKQSPGMISTPKGHVSLIDPYFKNSKGQRIDDVVYPYDYLKNARINRHKRKVNYISKHKMKGVHLAKYTLKYDTSLDEQQKIDEAEEYARLNGIYHFDKYPQELPICVIVPTLNNQAESRFEYSLNSIFTQNYTNYFVVIINDASTDNSDFMYRSYLNFYQIPPQRYAYIENKVRKTAMVNIYDAEYNYCSEDSITVVADGDDQLIGKNVFKTYNAAYQRLKAGTLYSNYYFFAVDRRLEMGSSKEYSKQTKTGLTFRKEPAKFSHLRSHKTALFRAIDKSAFQDSKGNFYTITCDFAMYIPLMEKACGRVYYIEEFFYLYNTATGLNDNTLDYWGQEKVADEVRGKPKQECVASYKETPFMTLQ